LCLGGSQFILLSGGINQYVDQFLARVGHKGTSPSDGHHSAQQHPMQPVLSFPLHMAFKQLNQQEYFHIASGPKVRIWTLRSHPLRIFRESNQFFNS
jgi:hypothetical protein